MDTVICEYYFSLISQLSWKCCESDTETNAAGSVNCQSEHSRHQWLNSMVSTLCVLRKINLSTLFDDSQLLR